MTKSGRYYDKTKTFYENGYTYQSDQLGMVTLYNKENKFTYVDQIDRYTGKYISIEENMSDQLEKDSWTKPKCISIVNSCFSDTEKNRVRETFIFPDFVTFWRLKNIISDFQQHRIIKG